MENPSYSSTITILKTCIYVENGLVCMEKHVHSILAKDFQRKKRKTHKPITNKNTHTHEHSDGSTPKELQNPSLWDVLILFQCLS